MGKIKEPSINEQFTIINKRLDIIFNRLNIIGQIVYDKLVQKRARKDATKHQTTCAKRRKRKEEIKIRGDD